MVLHSPAFLVCFEIPIQGIDIQYVLQAGHIQAESRRTPLSLS